MDDVTTRKMLDKRRKKSDECSHRMYGKTARESTTKRKNHGLGSIGKMRGELSQNGC